jgi:hypothetical protein
MQMEKIKAMVDRHIEKMIATLKEKASHETESLTKMLSDCKQQLENAKAIKKREEKIQQSRDDDSTIQHLQKLNDDVPSAVNAWITDVILTSNVVRPSSICFPFALITSSFVCISSLKVVLRLEITSFILDILWPLCLPVTHF